MKARIHFIRIDGTEDSVDLVGYDADNLRAKADEELAKRGGSDPWSEILED